ncbi:MAG: hypothetical protein CMM93_03250 [Rickettsiales bacterium]|nr:hypothetical protein [Rickettsiales bacterium]
MISVRESKRIASPLDFGAAVIAGPIPLARKEQVGVRCNADASLGASDMVINSESFIVIARGDSDAAIQSRTSKWLWIASLSLAMTERDDEPKRFQQESRRPLANAAR